MSNQFFYLQLKFTPKIGHTFTNERGVVVKVPKGLVKRKSKLINECLREVIALRLAKKCGSRHIPDRGGTGCGSASGAEETEDMARLTKLLQEVIDAIVHGAEAVQFYATKYSKLGPASRAVALI
jgi:hypothetical protein